MESDTRSDQEKAAASQSGELLQGEAGTSRFVNGTGPSPPARGVHFPSEEELEQAQHEICPACARHTAFCRYPRDRSALRNDYRFFKQD